jgi:TM2 domain-containing membrane protein YozV
MLIANNLTTKNKLIAYIFWLSIFCGLGGIHRLYLGKYLTGLIWLFSGGLLGIGQLIDLVLIPQMIEAQNLQSEDEILEYEVI